MSGPHVRVLLAVLVLLLAAPGLARSQPPEPPPGAAAPAPADAASPADVIVIFRDGVDSAQRDQVLRGAGAAVRRNFRIVNAAAAHLPSAAVRARLEQHPAVRQIIPDRPVHAHKNHKGGGGGGGSAQVLPEGVKRIKADQVWGTGYTGAGVGVAVVDTGLDFNHADLQPLAGADYSAFNGSCQDDNGHGTHVGGIVAARYNAQDVVGVAFDATLYCVKVLNQSGSGSDSTVMDGLQWVADNANLVNPPIRVVNMSLGRPGSLDDNPALRQMVQAVYGLGVSVVVSAGNDPYSEVSQQVPATYPEVMAVASTTAAGGSNQCRWYNGVIAADTASYFTTDGAYNSLAYNPTTGIGVTVSAPGADREDINRSCFINSQGILSTKLGGGTTRMSGTSMAAPHVAGVVALMWQKFSELTHESIWDRLRGSAERTGAAPLNSPSSAYTFDGEREGILSAPGALQ